MFFPASSSAAMTGGLSFLAQAFLNYDQARHQRKQTKMQQSWQQAKQHRFDRAFNKIVPADPNKTIQVMAQNRFAKTASVRQISPTKDQRPKSTLFQNMSDQGWQQHVAPRQKQARAVNHLHSYTDFLSQAQQQQRQTQTDLARYQRKADQSAGFSQNSGYTHPLISLSDNLLRLI